MKKMMTQRNWLTQREADSIVTGVTTDLSRWVGNDFAESALSQLDKKISTAVKGIVESYVQKKSASVASELPEFKDTGVGAIGKDAFGFDIPGFADVEFSTDTVTGYEKDSHYLFITFKFDPAVISNMVEWRDTYRDYVSDLITKMSEWLGYSLDSADAKPDGLADEILSSISEANLTAETQLYFE